MVILLDFVPFLTHFGTHFGTRFRRTSVLISDVPCISGVLARTENRCSNRAFWVSTWVQKMTIFSSFFRNPSSLPNKLAENDDF